MKKIVMLFYVFALSLFLFINASVSAQVLEATGDSFTLLEDSYDKDDKFVFAARANFLEGQAAGLVFGAKENEYYYVLNMDRYENAVKLLYFTKNESGEGFSAKELKTEMFIGSNIDLMRAQNEVDMVFPKVRGIENVDFKIIITPESDGKVYAEFFVDGIKRFGVDETITLDEKYVGGNLGFNVFNSKVDFTEVEIGESDYSYYTEMYRNQYHFSQFKNWNNDPNGLVYYEGYYHLYFQHHPYSKFWSDMYWGHARSKDLVHWEQLPICLFPDTDYGYAWSGSAMVYHKGENSIIDSWFTKETGLLAFYTADGDKQNQIIISSDDGGMTWIKHKEYVVSQDLVPNLGYGHKFDCRDPRVFKVEDDGKKLYGMVVSGMNPEVVWLLQSEDMLHWSFATSFKLFRPECVDVVKLTADDNTTHTVLTFEGREYLVGEFKINNDNKIYFEKYDSNGNFDVTNKTKDEINASKMDFGPDSYATQSFYIDDPESEYYGKSIATSWFSGVPGAEQSADSGSFASVRTKWNGSGFTIPVEYGLKKVGDEYVLTQKPITIDNTDLDKKELVNISNKVFNPSTSKAISFNDNTHQLEIIAKFNNPNKEDIEFILNIGEDEYTTVGWNKTDGYYVDRTNTSDGGINFPNYHRKYSTGPVDTTTPTFYILSDNGGIEVFCEDFTKPFYVLTLSSVYSTNNELHVGGEVTIETLKVNKIKSTFYDEDEERTDGVVYIDKTDVRLDLTLTKTENILFYTTLTANPTWEIISGEEVIKINSSNNRGATIEALATGEAVIKVTCGNVIKEIKVLVEDGASVSDIEFKSEGIVGGRWYQTSAGLIGKQSSGDGYILSTKSLKNCYYTAQFDLGSGAAAALILRAKSDMSDYIMVNYDKNGNVVKVWTPKRELANVNAGSVDPSNITLTAIIEGNNGQVVINGRIVANFTLNETDSQEGYLGLNVCATTATFKSVTLQDLSYNYNGGDFEIKINVNQYINKIVNVTMNNQSVDKSFIKVDGRTVIISEEYFTTLSKTGEYQFEIYGTSTRLLINVDINSLPSVSFEDVELIETENLNVYIGNTEVSSVYLNNVLLKSEEYSINDYVLTINGSLLKLGENVVKIGDKEIKVTVRELGTTDFIEESDTPSNPPVKPNPQPQEKPFNVLLVIIPVVSVVVIAAIVLVVILIKKKKRG